MSPAQNRALAAIADSSDGVRYGAGTTLRKSTVRALARKGLVITGYRLRWVPLSSLGGPGHLRVPWVVACGCAPPDDFKKE